jgi:hypothetical protein
MERATRRLHRLTEYLPALDAGDDPVLSPELLAHPSIGDPDRRPPLWKQYPDDLPVVPLPRTWPVAAVPALSVLAGAARVADARLDLAAAARVLHLSAGIVRTSPRSSGPYPFRAAGSAGGRFPLEFYLAVPAGSDLPAGVHWYRPDTHELVTVGPPPADGMPTVIVTGVPWRTGWRYAERGYRHIFWDAGTAISQTLAVATAAGLRPALVTEFPDRAVAELVGADGVHEFPVALIALGGGDPGRTPSGPAVPGRLGDESVEFPLVTAAHRAGDRDDVGTAWPVGDLVTLPDPPDESLDDLVLRRGSQRLMDPNGALSRDVVEASMSVSMRGIDVPHWVVVNNVDGLDRGVYRWPHLDSPIITDDLRERMYHLCVEQGLGRDAAVDVIAAIDLDSLDDHGYRDAQLAAGIVEGRLHLMAYALGACASGMTFYDSAVRDLLGEAVDGLIITCVGVPAYRNRPGGPPGAPVNVTHIETR